MIHLLYYFMVEKKLKFEYWKKVLVVVCTLYSILLLYIYSYTELSLLILEKLIFLTS